MNCNQPSLPRAKANRTNDQSMPDVLAIFKQWKDLAARPPTGEQLALIWPMWNALPADMIPELKRRILVFDESNKYLQDPEQRAAFVRLRRQFPRLPLDSLEFTQALNRAEGWSKLVLFLQTTLAHHKDLVTRQWAFAEADAHAAGRIAIFRAAQELEITHPGLLKSTSPKLVDIALLESRYAAYSKARDEALTALASLLYKVPGMRAGKRLPIDKVALGVLDRALPD